MQLPRKLRRRLLAIDRREASFSRRGFPRTSAHKVARLEAIGSAFVRGYEIALQEPGVDSLGRRLDALPRELTGFAYEGAAMALALLDRLVLAGPSRSALLRLLDGPGDRHAYMVHIGAGWAWARLGRLAGRIQARLRPLDPVLRWLTLDGYGFHQAYFHPHETVDAQRVPRAVTGYARRGFDLGIGRALWFVCGADPEGVADRIHAFPAPRRSELWAGAGLACSYAGAVTPDEIARLATRAGPHRPSLAQGAAFAAKARLRAGNPAAHTSRAVEILCATSAELAAKQCDLELSALGASPRSDGPVPDFERWRRSVRRSFARAFAAAEGAGGV